VTPALGSASPVDESALAHRRSVRRWQTLVTWLIASGLLAFLVVRLPAQELRAALTAGPVGRLAALAAAFGLTAFVADVFATRVAFAVTGVARPLGELFVVRGATYLLNLVSPAVGQGGLGVYLARTGVEASRAVAAVALVFGSFLGAMVLVSAGGLAASGTSVPGQGRLILTVLVAGFVLWLALLAWRPAALAGRRWLAPWFEPGVAGTLLATAARVPHVLAIVLGLWAALRLWGVDVPLGPGFALLAFVLLVGALPVAPAGLGTTEAALVWLASPYSTLPTATARESAVLSLCLLYHVIGLAVQAIIALPCLPALNRERTSSPREPASG
jgi:uncharacterized membrane protein YbhN (UPF0104 family)